jgi:predicted nucleic acid-binding protein
LIGWLLDTNVTAEIISAGDSARVKAWAAGQDEATLHPSILTIAEYDKGIANLPDGAPSPNQDCTIGSRSRIHSPLRRSDEAI